MIISNDPNKFNAKKFNIVIFAMHCFTCSPLHKRNFLLNDDINGTKKKKTNFKQYFNLKIIRDIILK